jgi:hypothetical protein
MRVNRGMRLGRAELRAVQAAALAWGLALSTAGCATSATSDNTAAGATPRISFARTTNWRTFRIPAPATTTDASLDAISCRAAARCVAGGTFFTSTPDSPDAFTVSYTSGKWAPAKPLIMPAGTTSSQLNGLACVASGPCMAVGTYTTSAGPSYGFVAEQSRGRWAPATRLLQSANDRIASLNGVTCTAPGDCVAVGSIYTPRHGEMPMIVTEASGRWQKPSEISPPAKPTPRYGGDQLSSVACQRTGYCVAVGVYNVTADPSHLTVRPMVVIESHERWLPARGIQAPADTASIPDAPGVGVLDAVGLGSVSCAPHGPCLATGTYLATPAQFRGLAVSELHGRWGSTQELIPARGTTVACNIAYCLIAGGGSARASPGIAVTYARGRWGQVAAIRPPADANQSAAMRYQIDFGGVACFPGGRCIAAGSYIDKSGHRAPVVATRS